MVYRRSRPFDLCCQLAQQRLRLLQIARIKPFCKPAIDRSEKLASLIPLALVAPEPRHAHCGAQFPGLGLLALRNAQRRLEGALALVEPVETVEGDAFER